MKLLINCKFYTYEKKTIFDFDQKPRTFNTKVSKDGFALVIEADLGYKNTSVVDLRPLIKEALTNLNFDFGNLTDEKAIVSFTAQPI